MATKKDCSLPDTTKLRELILKNPDFPLLIFYRSDIDLDYSWTMGRASDGSIQDLALYNDEVWYDWDEYREHLEDDLCDEEEYKDLSDEEWEQMIDSKMEEVEFVKAIVIWVD